jgi:diacylglycerol kinase (ATP)
MRVCLFLNAKSGAAMSSQELTALLTRAGHTIERVVERPAELPHPLDSSIDCVVAAGGDGTVARAGRAMAGGDIPLAILPLGTANNIAASLGISGRPDELIAAWTSQRVVRIDVGVVEEQHGETAFLESVGAGLVVAGMTAADALLPESGEASTNVSRAQQLYADLVHRLRPHHCAITIDDTALEGDYLLVEVLNTPSIGPGVCLSAEVSPADGLLSVVVATEADREALASYLSGRTNGARGDAGLKSWRARRVELRGLQSFHLDDDLRAAKGGTVSIGIRPASLAVLS